MQNNVYLEACTEQFYGKNFDIQRKFVKTFNLNHALKKKKKKKKEKKIQPLWDFVPYGAGCLLSYHCFSKIVVNVITVSNLKSKINNKSSHFE